MKIDITEVCYSLAIKFENYALEVFLEDDGKGGLQLHATLNYTHHSIISVTPLMKTSTTDISDRFERMFHELLHRCKK